MATKTKRRIVNEKFVYDEMTGENKKIFSTEIKNIFDTDIIIVNRSQYVLKISDKCYIKSLNLHNSLGNISITEDIKDAKIYTEDVSLILDDLKHKALRIGAKLYKLEYILTPIEIEE